MKHVVTHGSPDSRNLNTCFLDLTFTLGDAHAFDDEWQNEILKFKPSGRPHNLENNPRMRSVGYENAVPRELRRR